MEKKYIRATKAHEILDVSRTKFWRLTKHDDFPKKRNLFGSVVYKIQELIEWVDSKAEIAS